MEDTGQIDIVTTKFVPKHSICERTLPTPTANCSTFFNRSPGVTQVFERGIEPGPVICSLASSCCECHGSSGVDGAHPRGLAQRLDDRLRVAVLPRHS